LSLKFFPDKVLRQICEPVKKFDAEIHELSRKMLVLMKINKGIGLAAPQVGITKRLFVCEIENKSLILINPRIIQTSGESKMTEGCLSLPEIRVNIKRSNRLLLNGFNPWGKEMQYEMTGLWARVVQHEMDHLNGILICDYGKNRQNKKVKKDRQDAMEI